MVLWQTQSWHNPIPIPVRLDVDYLMGKFKKLPASLETEEDIKVFADAICAPLADEAIEPHLGFPNYYFCSRPWLREKFLEFRAWFKGSGQKWGKAPRDQVLVGS